MGDRIRLSVLTRSLLEDSYNKLATLSETLVDKPDEERKAALEKYLKKSMIQFTRLLVLIKWSDKLQSLQQVQNLVRELETRDELFKKSRESLVQAALSSQLMKVPLFDVPTAVDVLATGGYNRLPSILEKTHVLVGRAPERPLLTAAEIEFAKARLDEMIRLRLLWSKIPMNFEVPVVKDGKVVFTVFDEFQATLTLLQGVNQTAPWTLIKLHFLIAPDSSYGDNFVTAEWNRRVEGMANAAMAADPKDPLKALYEIGHSFAQNLQLEILAAQAEIEKPTQETYIASRKVVVQTLTHSPGEFLELSFPGFKLRFAANGPLAVGSGNASNSLENVPTPSTPSDALAKKKSSTRANDKHNAQKKKRITRGATLTLRERRVAATRLTVQSFPAVFDVLTGELAEYEINPRCIDLESVVSRAKRLYAHARLELLADALRSHIDASQQVIQARMEQSGLDTIIEETDFALSNTADAISGSVSGASSPLPSSPFQPSTAKLDATANGVQERAFALLNLSPQDVTVHINNAIFKSFISIRLFKTHCAYIHLSGTDGKPLLKPGLGLTPVQVEQIQAKLRKHDIDSNLAESLQELQRQAVMYALGKISSAFQLSPLPVALSTRLSLDFLRQFGKHHLVLRFTEPTMAQSCIVACLDYLIVTPPSPPLPDASQIESVSLFSSSSSISSMASTLASNGQPHSNNDASNMQNPALANALSPLRIRFVLMASQTPETYSSQHGVLLHMPIFTSSSESPTESDGNMKKRAFPHEAADANKTHMAEDVEDGPRASKKAKLVESDTSGVYHQESSANQARFARVGAILSRAKNILDRSGASMEWYSILGAVVSKSKEEVTRVLVLDDLKLQQPQVAYKPYGTLHRMGVVTEAQEEVTTSGGLGHGRGMFDELSARFLSNGDNFGRAYAKQYGASRNGHAGSMAQSWNGSKRDALAAASNGHGALTDVVAFAAASGLPLDIGGTVNDTHASGSSGRRYLLSKVPVVTSPLHIQQMVLTIESDHWFVTLTESQSLLPSGGVPIEPFLEAAENVSLRSIRFKDKEWRFSYPRATPIQTFLSDLRGLAIIYKYLQQFMALTKTHCPSGQNKNFSPEIVEHLSQVPVNGSSLDMNFFRLIAISPTHLTFAYGEHVHELEPSLPLTHQHYRQQSQPLNTSGAQTNYPSTMSSPWTPMSHASSQSSMQIPPLKSSASQQVQTPMHASQSSNSALPGMSPSMEGMNPSGASDARTQREKSVFRGNLQLQYANVFKIMWKAPLGASTSSVSTMPPPARQDVPIVTFEPGEHPLEAFINSSLVETAREPYLLTLLELIWNVHPLISNVNDFLASQHGTMRSNDLVIRPQSKTKLRLFFRQWCLEWRFLGNRFVCVEEIKRTSSDTPPLLNFLSFMATALQRLKPNPLDSSAPAAETPSHTMNPSPGAPAGIGHHLFPSMTEFASSEDALAAAQNAREGETFFIGPSFVVLHSDLIQGLLPMLYAYFGSYRLFTMIEKEERQPRQTNENGEPILHYHQNDTEEVKVSLVLRKPLYSLDVVLPQTIAQDDVEGLSQLMKTKVVCTPYRVAHLRAFLAIFQLPMAYLSDLVAVLRFSSRHPISADLHFSLKETMTAVAVHKPTPEDQSLSITLSLLFSNQEYSQDLIMAICYNYKTRQLSSTDPFSHEFLARNGFQGSYGTLAGAVDSLCRTLQRTWPVEFNNYLKRNPHVLQQHQQLTGSGGITHR